jgi:hypothetical protein
VYRRRDEDPDFAVEWDRAKQIGAEALEDEANRRAYDGWDEPLAEKGRLTGHVVRKFSDTLLIFLLKGAKPDKYKDRVQSEVSGPQGKPIEVNDQSAPDRLAAILAAATQRRDAGEDLA